MIKKLLLNYQFLKIITDSKHAIDEWKILLDYKFLKIIDINYTINKCKLSLKYQFLNIILDSKYTIHK